jgi:hypothetical protein
MLILRMKEKKRAVLKCLFEKLERSRGSDIKRSVDEYNLRMGVLDDNFIELTQFIKDYEKNEEIIPAREFHALLIWWNLLHL